MDGVILEDYVNSRLFEEQFDGKERYQIENAILLVDDELNNQCDERAISERKLLKSWLIIGQKKALDYKG